MARALLLFFFSPISALMLGAAGVRGERGCSPNQCGNVSISSPFGLVSGSEKNKCGTIGFQVHCTDNTPYLGYYEPGLDFQILNIFYENNSLLVSDIHKLEGFSSSGNKGCHVPTANTASKIMPPFSISTINRKLVFYNCTKAPAPVDQGLVEMVCHNNTFVRTGGRYDGTGDSLEGCTATVVPVLGASGMANASNYEELISDGFLLTWQPVGSGSKMTGTKNIILIELQAGAELDILTEGARQLQAAALRMHQEEDGLSSQPIRALLQLNEPDVLLEISDED